MSLTTPILGIYSQPYNYSPVYGPANYWAFHGTFSSTSAIPSTSKVYIDITILHQGNGGLVTTDTYAGRFKVPIRSNNTYVWNAENVLKSFVTFPYDKGQPTNYGIGGSYYVNECVGFASGAATSSYPTISPEPEGFVRYQLGYGLEYNPNFTFLDLGSVTGLAGGNTIYASFGVNYFCSVGDVITITMDSGLYQYWTGTASVLAIGDNGIDTFVTTDQIVDADALALILASGGIMSGSYTLVNHYVGTTTGENYAYNGVCQYMEKNFDFSQKYLITGGSAPQFMTDFGYDSDHCIPIQLGQYERARFLFDFTQLTFPGDYLNIYCDIYDSNGTYLTTVSVTDIQYIFGSAAHWHYKCYTIQLFIRSGFITSTTFQNYPVIPGYKYAFYFEWTISGSLHSSTELWYVATNACAQYNNYRIKFLNRQGTWQYWNFYKDSKQTSEITRTEYTRPLQWDYSINPTPATYIPSPNYSLSKQRGQSVLHTDVQETFTLNSDWITEDEYAFLQQLVTSPEVHIFYDALIQPITSIYGGVNIPIIITDTNYMFKTRKRDRLFNLTINYKYAFGTKIQNP